MIKIKVSTFSKALDILAALRQRHIPASYFPNGGQTKDACLPVTHQIAVRLEDEAVAVQIVGLICQ